MHDPPAAASRNRVILGIDLGGTTTKLGLLGTGQDALTAFRSQPTAAYRPAPAVLADVAAAVAQLTAEAEAGGATVGAIGLCMPAALARDGRVEVLPNFAEGWVGIMPAVSLSAATGLPVTLVNDARAFTLAEARHGAAHGSRAALGVTFGTGVGGGLVLNGELYLGPSGKAGELGHMVMDPNGPRCGCGSRGCLETYASATAVRAAVTRPFLLGGTPVLHSLTGGSLDAVTLPYVAEAARRGDQPCLAAIERAALWLGVAIANVTTLLAIDRVVIGGGMAGLGEQLFEPLRAHLRAYAQVVGADLPVVLPTALGDSAGALGAALMAADVLPTPYR